MTKIKPLSESHFVFATVINNEFKRRQKKNPRYSLRSFARDSGFDASTISKWLRNEREMASIDFVLLVGRLQVEEAIFLKALAQVEHQTSVSKRAKAGVTRFLSRAEFKEVGHFYISIILHVIALCRPKYDIQELMELIRMDRESIRTGLEALLKVGMVRVRPDGYLERTQNFIAMPSFSEKDELFMRNRIQALNWMLEDQEKAFSNPGNAPKGVTSAMLFTGRYPLNTVSNKKTISLTQLDAMKRIQKRLSTNQSKNSKKAVYAWSLSILPVWVEK